METSPTSNYYRRMARFFLSRNMLTRSSQNLLRPGEGWAQPFCRAFELHCHFVVTKKPFCRVGGLVPLQNEGPRPHRGNGKGDILMILDSSLFIDIIDHYFYW